MSKGTKSPDFRHWRRAQEAVAQGCLTNSKHPRTFVQGVYPTHVKRGNGAFLEDMDGNQYLDFICGLGSNLFGYGNSYICQAVEKELHGGFCHSLPTLWEVRAAEKLKEFFPFAHRTKFLKTGSEACSAALRIARNATGRTTVLSEGYHGFHDQFVALTPPAQGCVPGQVLSLSKHEHKAFEGIAAVIVEPVITDDSLDRREWLKKLREKCTKAGTMLIFDEVITGFRYPKYGVCNAWGIEPDLLVLGKSIAGGLPLAAVCGKEGLMDEPGYFVSSTYAGEVTSFAAALKVFDLLQKNSDFDIDRLVHEANRFTGEFNGFKPDQIVIEGYGTRGVFKGDPEFRALFFQEACKAGILFGPSFFFGFQHMEHSKRVIKDLWSIIEKIRKGGVTLEGDMPSSPFAARVRDE